MIQTATIRMQPLNVKRQPLYPIKLVARLPRDGRFRRVKASWELDPTKEMPYYLKVWADDRAIISEVQAVPPNHMRRLNSFTVTQDLRVLPRRS